MFLLAENNATQYLTEHGFISPEITFNDSNNSAYIESRSSKNFSLFVRVSTQHQFLVKQERMSASRSFKGDLRHEWKVYELVRQFPELTPLHSLISEAIHFDEDCAILVFRYLSEYVDLGEFYEQHHCFSPAIASTLGKTLAHFHRATLDRQDYRTFLEGHAVVKDDHVPDFDRDFRELTPEKLQHLSTDGLNFYRFYQRDRALQKAIANLGDIYEPCCLIHDDLKFDNILLHQDWHTLLTSTSATDPTIEAATPLRIIDWERWSWGDPTHDVGNIVAQFLKLWLKSLTVNRNIDIQLALQLAATPLEQIQPSLIAFIQAYIAHMPGLLKRFPDFLTRVMQFAGLSLLDRIQARLHYYEPFGNVEICMFQVAGRLLCHPQPSIQTVFGLTAAQLLNPLLSSPVTSPAPSISPSETMAQEPISAQPSNVQPIDQPSAQFKDNPRDQPTDQQSDNALNRPVGSAVSHPLTAPSGNLPLTLETLTQTLIIQSDRTFAHPPYAPVDPTPLLRDHVDDIPASLRRSLWLRQLRDYLYDIYVSGESSQQQEQVSEQSQNSGHARDNRVRSITLPGHKPLTNNARRGLDADLYDALHRHNHGNGYFDPGWRVTCVLKSGWGRVVKEGLTLSIHPMHHLRPSKRFRVGQSVSIRLPNHQIESGFYVAIGDAGTSSEERAAVEFCLNLTAEGAIQCMDVLTNRLNALSFPFSLKVLIDADGSSRRDGVVLHTEHRHYPKLFPILQDFYVDLLRQDKQRSEGDRLLSPDPSLPLFMKAIAPGIGVAEEPDTEPHDFGLHRCEILAEALISAWEAGENGPEARMHHIEKAFAQYDLNLNRPYLNPGSKDIYRPLLPDRQCPDALVISPQK